MNKDVWEQLFQLMLLDAMHKDLLAEGYAINSSGVAIDMEEIKRCENMYTGDDIGVFDDLNGRIAKRGFVDD
jgi:hypothetical protein